MYHVSAEGIDERMINVHLKKIFSIIMINRKTDKDNLSSLSVLFFASFFFLLSIFLHPKKTIVVESARQTDRDREGMTSNNQTGITTPRTSIRFTRLSE